MSGETKTTETTNGAVDPTAALTEFWTRWAEQAGRGTQAMLDVLRSGTDPKKLQQLWMDAAAQSLDQFMRTPAFMEMMRRQLKAVTDAKRLQDQIVHGTARQFGMPLAADVGGLFERLHSTERVVLERLAAIEARLDALAARIEGRPADTPGE
jgi:hypothetical protein